MPIITMWPGLSSGENAGLHRRRKGVAVDRSIECDQCHHARCGAGLRPSGGLPVAVWHAGPQPLALRQRRWPRALLAPTQVWSTKTNRSGLWSRWLSNHAPLQDISTTLLACTAHLFAPDWARAKNRQSVAILVLTPCPARIVRNSSSVTADC